MTMTRGMLTTAARDTPSPEYVRHLAAHGFAVTIEDLCGPSRARPLVEYRQIAMAAMREVTGASYPAIGKIFGGRDHSTVMHACTRVRSLPRLMNTRDKLCREVAEQWAIDTGTRQVSA